MCQTSIVWGNGPGELEVALRTHDVSGSFLSLEGELH